MSFILYSVGALGGNRPDDVKVIQWLLNQANTGYCFTNCVLLRPIETLRLPSAYKPLYASNIPSSGILDTETQKAIDDFAALCYRRRFLSKEIAQLQSAGSTIQPDGDLYKRLIWATVHTYAPRFIVSADDYDDPRVKEALDGRIDFTQFQKILEQSRWKGLTPLGKQMQKLISEPSVTAFLGVIAKAESWFDSRHDQVAYDDRVGFVKLPNLYEHPGRVAGRYQFDTNTWNIAKRDLGLYDFTPESQDIAGAYQLYYRPTIAGSILAALRAGDFDEAVQRGAGVWASFPDRFSANAQKGFTEDSTDASHYPPQKNAPLSGLRRYYNQYLQSR